MQATDFERFRSVMAGLAEMYGKALSPTLLDGYWIALDDWTLADFTQAAKHLMKHGTYFPRPADFTALRKAAGETAPEAFQRALANCARWRQGECGDADPAINAALLAIGGNRELAMCPTDQLHWKEKRFCEVYEEQREVTSTRQVLGLPDPTPRLPSTGGGFVAIGQPGRDS